MKAGENKRERDDYFVFGDDILCELETKRDVGCQESSLTSPTSVICFVCALVHHSCYSAVEKPTKSLL